MLYMKDSSEPMVAKGPNLGGLGLPLLGWMVGWFSSTFISVGGVGGSGMAHGLYMFNNGESDGDNNFSSCC